MRGKRKRAIEDIVRGNVRQRSEERLERRKKRGKNDTIIFLKSPMSLRLIIIE